MVKESFQSYICVVVSIASHHGIKLSPHFLCSNHIENSNYNSFYNTHYTGLDDIRSDSEDGDTLPHQDEPSADFSVDEGPQPFSQSELIDLVRDLGLYKDGADLLGSRLKNKILLTPGTSFSWYRHREKEFTQFFSKERNLVFCNDV
ncbi:hypothetical protein AVEN_81264-1 [Araneus ventricosus]|uniref:Uncharacterized protein n=1 Tax=Araneus ventricosus TaxID=182803 RepID=A0A4Y2FI48_ARAVE|nr:hypothetical protein AVEN_81264-1 [Araneus ventricosus]